VVENITIFKYEHSFSKQLIAKLILIINKLNNLNIFEIITNINYLVSAVL